MMKPVASAELPTKYGKFIVHGFRENGKEHTALVRGGVKGKKVAVRIHSKCLTGDAFRSMRCDCGEQLERSLRYIGKNGGVLIYLDQEGRGIGLVNKIKAYSLQDKGMDTSEANRCLGFGDDMRNYDAAIKILRTLKISKITLMTNNPEKLDAMAGGGIPAERMPMKTKLNKFNADYINTKRSKFGHLA